MSCLGWFKRRSRSDGASSGKRGASAPPSSGPATATTTTTTTVSGVSTSRSDDSGAVRPVSKSAGSAASSQSQRSISSLYEERGHGQLRVFDYEELQAATADFSRAQKLGEGGFGSVYKGFVRAADGKGDRIPVAVKKLNQRGLQGHKQWLAEVQFLGVLEHPNLVKLLGYCAVDSERGAQRLLVYEFMPNKSLEDHLFRRANPPLSWNKRLQVILGAAEGLAYLHEGVEVQVIYRDFKTSNILLDKDFRAKLSDFGLAREGPTGANTHVSTAVVGTQGYAAPEYVDSGHLTAKSDVFSFGVVLYEILTGRRSLDRNKPAAEQKMLEWVAQFPPDSRNFRMIMDPRLRGEYSAKAAREIAKLADSCLLKNAKERPTMGEVVEVLRRAVQAAEPDSRSPGAGAARGKRGDAAAPSRRMRRRRAQAWVAATARPRGPERRRRSGPGRRRGPGQRPGHGQRAGGRCASDLRASGRLDGSGTPSRGGPGGLERRRRSRDASSGGDGSRDAASGGDGSRDAASGGDGAAARGGRRRLSSPRQPGYGRRGRLLARPRAAAPAASSGDDAAATHPQAATAAATRPRAATARPRAAVGVGSAPRGSPATGGGSATGGGRQAPACASLSPPLS